MAGSLAGAGKLGTKKRRRKQVFIACRPNEQGAQEHWAGVSRSPLRRAPVSRKDGAFRVCHDAQSKSIGSLSQKCDSRAADHAAFRLAAAANHNPVK
jgi:hypothetical protein